MLPTFEDCTPGYWNNHGELWSQTTDSIVTKMPAGCQFTTTTKFNAYFGLTPTQSGFDNDVRMLGVVMAGGGNGAKLARHRISRLLSIADGVNYGNTLGCSGHV